MTSTMIGKYYNTRRPSVISSQSSSAIEMDDGDKNELLPKENPLLHSESELGIKKEYKKNDESNTKTHI